MFRNYICRALAKPSPANIKKVGLLVHQKTLERLGQPRMNVCGSRTAKKRVPGRGEGKGPS